MLLDEIKATLELENLHLEKFEEQLLTQYEKGLISFKELQNCLLESINDIKAA